MVAEIFGATPDDFLFNTTIGGVELAPQVGGIGPAEISEERIEQTGLDLIPRCARDRHRAVA